MITIDDKYWLSIFWERPETEGELFRIRTNTGDAYARQIAHHHALYYGLSLIGQPAHPTLLEWKPTPQNGASWQIVPDKYRLVELFNGEMEEILMELLL